MHTTFTVYAVVVWSNIKIYRDIHTLHSQCMWWSCLSNVKIYRDLYALHSQCMRWSWWSNIKYIEIYTHYIHSVCGGHRDYGGLIQKYIEIYTHYDHSVCGGRGGLI